jgi:hypothetical protein
MIQKEDTLSVFSRYKKWITVTPRSKNRKMPLEKIKAEKTEETSKIMPKWMQISAISAKPNYDELKSAEYLSRDVKLTKLIFKIE